MFGLRTRPKDVRIASFALGLCIFALMPTEIGYQDIGSLLARQSGVAERWQKRVYSAASSIQLATYSFGHLVAVYGDIRGRIDSDTHLVAGDLKNLNRDSKCWKDDLLLATS